MFPILTAIREVFRAGVHNIFAIAGRITLIFVNYHRQ